LSTRIRIGTRGSPLALWQARRIEAVLKAKGHAVELVAIETTGDVISEVPLSRIGSTSIFTRQLDEALLDGRIDLAVHSLKDLPTRIPEGLVLAAVSDREDPRDALVGKAPITWSTLPPDATVATSSPRRKAQLLRARPDLRVVEVRGKIETRLAKLDGTPEWSATLLAAAGLIRLGLTGRIGERLPFELMLPAPGQGALAVTARSDRPDVVSLAELALHHPSTARCVAAERALLRRLEGGCQIPVAALGETTDHHLRLRARVVALDGRQVVEGEWSGPADSAGAAEAAGTALAEQLLSDGAGDILAAVRGAR
jgi:hydroxymethylbilane synthase